MQNMNTYPKTDKLLMHKFMAIFNQKKIDFSVTREYKRIISEKFEGKDSDIGMYESLYAAI